MLDRVQFLVMVILVTNIDDICGQATKPKVLILVSLVKHSQWLTAPPLRVWVVQSSRVRCMHIVHVWQALERPGPTSQHAFLVAALSE